MRGKEAAGLVQILGCRITPAYAGKRICRCSHRPAHRDHPRVCGEKNGCHDPCLIPLGSPPRMRGKGTMAAPHHRAGGITPAYAGKSHCHPGQCGRNGDHPRVCGEKSSKTFTRSILKGSPPRMRGKDGRGYHPERQCGITPAYAGKRPQSSSRRNTRRDHPRVCGEKPSRTGAVPARTGSPPRMRGKAKCRAGRQRRPRITPAYAGKRPKRYR